MRVIEPSLVDDPDDAFRRFFRDEFDRTARLAFVLVRNSHLAEELAQEALARVQPVFPTLEAPAAYTRTVLMNLLKRHRAREARRRELEALATDPDVAVPEVHELLDAVDALPFRQRAVVVLRYYEDLSEAEIATCLGCRPGTVKSLASRALAQLRKEIEP